MPMERILLTILYAFLAWLLYYAESAGDNWKDRLPSLFLFMLLVGAIPEGVVCIYIGQRVHLYEVVAPRRDKSCGRGADKLGLRT